MNHELPEFQPTPIFSVASEVTLRDHFAVKAPIDFNVVCRAWGGDDPNLLEDKTRAAFFAVWALLRYEWADAMLAERAKT